MLVPISKRYPIDKDLQMAKAYSVDVPGSEIAQFPHKNTFATLAQR